MLLTSIVLGTGYLVAFKLGMIKERRRPKIDNLSLENNIKLKYEWVDQFVASANKKIIKFALLERKIHLVPWFRPAQLVLIVSPVNEYECKFLFYKNRILIGERKIYFSFVRDELVPWMLDCIKQSEQLTSWQEEVDRLGRPTRMALKQPENQKSV